MKLTYGEKYIPDFDLAIQLAHEGKWGEAARMIPQPLYVVDTAGWNLSLKLRSVAGEAATALDTVRFALECQEKLAPTK